jgi:hypothetical protein
MCPEMKSRAFTDRTAGRQHPGDIFYLYISISYVFGSIIPKINSFSSRRDRICRSNVRDRPFDAVGENFGLHDCQAPSEFQRSNTSHQIALAGFAQEIDVQIRSHSKRLRPDRGQKRHVERKIGQGHHGWARNRTAGTQKIRPISLTDPTTAAPHRLDRQSALRVKSLGKLLREEFRDLFGRHKGFCRHFPVGLPARAPPRVSDTMLNVFRKAAILTGRSGSP